MVVQLYFLEFCIDRECISSGNLASDIALKAVKTVLREENDKKEIDIKNYAKVEKVSILFYLLLCLFGPQTASH